MAYVACAEEIATLSKHYKSCLVLGNAQHAAVTLSPQNASCRTELA
jgi:hypothetical protein